MGTIAIPKLSQALSQEGDGYKRIRIVLCLSRIGGPQAKEGLKKALSSEKDESVRRYIRRALRLST
jgi:HEAT repeat protein